jgi:hypothetical protein
MNNNFSAVLLFVGIFSLACTKDKQTNSDEIPYKRLTMQVVGDLPGAVNETSGLAWVNNDLITHNDKGNSNHLFIIDTANAASISQVTLSGAPNTDWEDLATDQDYLYVHDAGNNNGNRRDLRIWRVAKSQWTTTGSVPAAGAIAFHYPEQTQFESNKSHNFDSEALFAYGDSLYLFTKNRGNQRADLYVLPKTPGNWPAYRKGDFNPESLITGATISPDGQALVLIGIQNKQHCYLYVFTNYQAPDFLNGKMERYYIGPFSEVGQTEALDFVGPHLFISSERVSKWALPARLYVIRDFLETRNN